jgi:opacity protein-like surface antigen
VTTPIIRGTLAVLLVIVGLSEQARAQSLSTVEALGFAGGVTDGGGATFGGGMQFGADRLIFAAEIGYLTLKSDFSSGNVNIDTSGISVDLNAHYLFPVDGNPRFTPYLLGGIGIIRVSASTTAGGVSGSASDSDAGLNLGGGARITVADNWGLRPEIKFLVKDGSSARFSLGVYYGFGR